MQRAVRAASPAGSETELQLMAGGPLMMRILDFRL